MIIVASRKANSKVLDKRRLQQVLFIYYPAEFNEFSIKALIDLGKKVNIMQPSFAIKLVLHIYKQTCVFKKLTVINLRIIR